MTHKIFIHHDGAIGDVILSLPAIDLIKDKNFIHISARYDIGDFLLKAHFVNEASIVGGAAYLSLYKDNPDVSLKKFFGQFKEAYVFSINKPSTIASSIKKILPNTYEIKTIPDKNLKKNVAEFRLRQLNSICRAPLPEDLFTYQYAVKFIKIPHNYIRLAEQYLINSGYDNKSPLLAMHPGSGGAYKCWQIENFFELAERLLKNFELFIIILTGYAEEGLIKEKINNFIKGKRNIIHISNEELIMIASFLNLCKIYLGNDSGISHLAALLCQNVFIIFSPTEPCLWKPPYENVRVILPNDEYLQNCRDNRCLTKISVSQVYNELYELLDLR